MFFEIKKYKYKCISFLMSNGIRTLQPLIVIDYNINKNKFNLHSKSEFYSMGSVSI